MDGIASRPYSLNMSSTETPSLTSNPGFSFPKKRRFGRYRPERETQASVEFRLADDSHWRPSLIEIGAGGLSFGLGNELPSLSVGWNIDPATIHLDDLRISGSLRIAYLTAEFAAETTCGAEFTPSTNADAGALTRLLARLERLGHRSG
jgi:hypothetical protein